MSDTLLIALSSIAASILSLIVTQGLAWWLNKKKLPSEVKQINSNSDLNRGELAEKYQNIASKAADENMDLMEQIRVKETEKKDLVAAMTKLRSDMELMITELDEKHRKEMEQLRQDLEKERSDSAKFKNWAIRLSLQLRAYNIVPVELEIEDAKQRNLELLEKTLNDANLEKKDK